MRSTSSGPRALPALLMAALTLGACAGSAPPQRVDMQAIARVPAPVATAAPAFGDLRPVAWTGRAPTDYPVHGIDAARYQGPIDFHAARAAGVSFAWLKATEGGDLLDPSFAGNYRAARRAGVPVGAYHFYYFCRPAEEQAAWFIRNVPRRAGDLPPVLDMEWNHLSPTCTYRPPAETVRDEIRTFSRIVERHYGTAPVIYTTPDFFDRNGLAQMRGQEFWLRTVVMHPSERYPGQRWSFWQYSGTGLVPGVQGKVDLNAFSGSRGAWQSWLARRAQG